MFRPVVAIIWFYHLTDLFYTIRVAACLMGRSQHQSPVVYWTLHHCDS